MIDLLARVLNLSLNGPSIAIIILMAVIILAFEIWMFVDLIQNENLPTETKLIWALGMFLLHPFIAIIYYFIASPKGPAGRKTI